MANSGIPWIDQWFDWCVVLLVDIAKFLGVTYEEVNVWLFCVALSLVLVVSFGLNVVLTLKLLRARRQADSARVSRHHTT